MVKCECGCEQFEPLLITTEPPLRGIYRCIQCRNIYLVDYHLDKNATATLIDRNGETK